MAHQKYQSCIEACVQCATECERCADACLDEKDVKMMAACIQRGSSDKDPKPLSM